MEDKNLKTDKGAFLISRRIWDSDIATKKPHSWFKIWIYLISEASHGSDGKYKIGECFLTYQKIMANTGATNDQVKKCFQYLRRMSKISTRRSTRGTRILINKYSGYQNLDNYRSTSSGTREALEKHYDRQQLKQLNKPVQSYPQVNQANPKKINPAGNYQIEKNTIVSPEAFIQEYEKRKAQGWRAEYGPDLVCVGRGQIRLKVHDGTFVDFNDSLTKILWKKKKQRQ